MKTHEIARVLTVLAQALRNGPNVPLEEFGRKSVPVDTSNVPAALSTLVALSEFDKGQWQALLSEYRLPIEVRPRDASRDILGKILKYLEQNADARNRLSAAATKAPSATSPELMRALQLLLKST